MINSFFKKNWHHFVAIAIFLIVSMVYFSPALNGYSLEMGDIKSSTGMSKELFDYRDIYGGEAVWTSTSFSGMPGYQIGVLYNNPIHLIYLFLSELLTFYVFALFFAFVSFYVLANAFKTNFLVAILGALAYGLATYNFTILEAGHTSKMLAIAFAPGVLAGMVLLYNRKNWIFPFAVLALFVSVELMVNHIQMTYYFAFLFFAYAIVELVKFIKEKKLKLYLIRTFLIVFATLIGLLSNFGNYYNTYKFAKQTMRGEPIISISANDTNLTQEKSEKDDAFETFNSNTGGLKRDYITQWCYGKGETWNLFIPNAKGNSRNATGEIFDKLKEVNPNMYRSVAEQYQQTQGKVFGGYWGDQPFTSGPTYMGAIIIFLALLYILFIHSPLKWALLSVSILTILLSWGKNLGGSIEEMWLTNFFIDHVPLYSKFRAVSSILVVVNLIAPLMAILFLSHLMKNKEWAFKNLKYLGIASGVIILVLVYLIAKPTSVGLTSEIENQQISAMSQQYMVSPQSFPFNPQEMLNQVIEIRSSIFIADAWRTLGLIVITIGLLFLFIRNEKLKLIALGGITVLVLIDLVGIDLRFLNNDKNPNNPTEYLFWNKGDINDNVFLATEGDMQIYQMEASQKPEILNQVNQRISQLGANDRTRVKQESVMFSSLNFNTNYRVMDVDNPFNGSRVSYFHKSTGGYSPAKLKRYQDVIDFYISKEINFLNTGSLENMKVLNMLNNKYYLYNGKLIALNTYANGNAWFVKDIKWVKTPEDEILEIANIDPKQTAIIHESFKEITEAPTLIDSSASIIMTNYLPNHISYKSNSKNNQLAVFSEVYYEDGWNAYIDGNKVPYSRANYFLRSLNIPNGDHTIEFKFEPTSFKMGNTINLVGFFLLVFSFGAAGYTHYKNRNKNEQE